MNLVLLIGMNIISFTLHLTLSIIDLFLRLLEQRALLLQDGLSNVELDNLINLQPELIDICQEIAAYEIKQTLVQPDFNFNNVLRCHESGKITFIDLGEISISHPFFAMHNFLWQLEKHYNFKAGSVVYEKVKLAYLNKFAADYSCDVATVFGISKNLMPLYAALSTYRLWQACGIVEMSTSKRGKISEVLRQLL